MVDLNDIPTGTELSMHDGRFVFNAAGTGNTTFETKRVGAPDTAYAASGETLTAPNNTTLDYSGMDIRITKAAGTTLSLSQSANSMVREIV